MLLKVATVEGIVAGRITRVYRRWAKPRAKAGGRQRTPLGELRIDAVCAVDPATLTDADARAAGHPDLDDLQRALATRDGTVFRIDLRFDRPDPRVALRDAAPTRAELADLRAALNARNRDVTGGELDSGKRRYLLRTIGRFASIEALEKAHAFISALVQVKETLGESLTWD